MITLPRYERLTQGTIFCGGRSEEYASLPVWGVIITARCDTAHQKVPQINYVPMVRIEDWLARHGGWLVLDEAQKDVKNRFKTILKNKGISESLLDNYKPKKIVEDHFFEEKKPDAKSRPDKNFEAIKSLADELELLSGYSTNPPNGSSMLNFLGGYEKLVEKYLTSLISHKLSGYYFVPPCVQISEHSSEQGYVVMLREIHHISSDSAGLLCDGIYRGSFKGAIAGMDFETFDFVYPVAQIASPWVEHLLQVFCMMFGRIGVEDFDQKKAKHIAEAITKRGEI